MPPLRLARRGGARRAEAGSRSPGERGDADEWPERRGSPGEGWNTKAAASMPTPRCRVHLLRPMIRAWTAYEELHVEIRRAGTQASTKGPADWFTGTVRVDPL